MAIDQMIKKLNESGKFNKPIVTEVMPLTKFWEAEAYHQGYYDAHPDNPYIQSVSRPKVEKFKKLYKDKLKKEYM